MLALSLTYRFISNFALLAMAYFSLNLIENYDQRAVLALLIMAYAGTRIVSAIRSFQFHGKIEQLESDFKRVLGAIDEIKSRPVPAIVTQVGTLRRHGEMKAYLDLFFLSVIVIICITKLYR